MPRARDLQLTPGILPPGPLNALTDVAGVRVGHRTLILGDSIRTGATAILPHEGSLYHERVPAALAIANAFGKFIGATQIAELGELETPVLLTNTLAAPRAADALIDWTLARHAGDDIRSVNPVVGETNDGYLNDIRARALTTADFAQALDHAAGGPVAEGNTGAGTGTSACGFKAGIGTSSRVLPPHAGGHTLGILVQSNFPGILCVCGREVGRALGIHHLHSQLAPPAAEGSIIIVLATNAPLSPRALHRLALRTFAGLARTGATFAHGSGDYALAFSTASAARRTPAHRAEPHVVPELPPAQLDLLFQAAIEATEEAILNSFLMAETMTGHEGRTIRALPLGALA